MRDSYGLDIAMTSIICVLCVVAVLFNSTVAAFGTVAVLTFYAVADSDWRDKRR